MFNPLVIATIGLQRYRIFFEKKSFFYFGSRL